MLAAEVYRSCDTLCVVTNMDKLFLMLVDRPELARELPVIPCALLAALALDDDEHRDTTPAFPPRLRLAA